MSDFITATGAISLVVGIAGGQIVAYFQHRIMKTRKLTRQLNDACVALRHHYEELDNFVQDPGSPATLKQLLFTFSDIVNDRDEAIKFVKRTGSKSRIALSSEAQELLAEIERLRTYRQDLAVSFDRCIGMGFASMLLRWSETAEAYYQATSSIIADRYQEIDFVANLRKDDRKVRGPSLVTV